MIVVDSSVWIHYFNGTDNRQTSLLDSLLSVQPILIGDLIITEVLQGFRSESDFQRAISSFSKLNYADMVGQHIASTGARNYRSLRERGLTVRKTIDILIATFCIERGHVLLHADRDFDPLEEHLGLQTV